MCRTYLLVLFALWGGIVSPVSHATDSFCDNKTNVAKEQIAFVPDWAQKANWYYLVPDRFYRRKALGVMNPLDKGQVAIDRETLYRNYGGTLKGLELKLSYLKYLGFNAIYLDGVFIQTSDSPEQFHVDPYLGENVEQDLLLLKDFPQEKSGTVLSADVALRSLIKTAHKLGLKIALNAMEFEARNGLDFKALKQWTQSDTHPNGANAWQVDIVDCGDIKLWHSTFSNLIGSLYLFDANGVTHSHPASGADVLTTKLLLDFAFDTTVVPSEIKSHTLTSRRRWSKEIAATQHLGSFDFAYPRLFDSAVDSFEDTNILASDGVLERAKLYLTLLFTYQGVPVTLFGDELALSQNKSDEASIPSMVWPESKQRGNQFDTTIQLREHVRQLLSARNRYFALSKGNIIPLIADDEARIYAYMRQHAGQRVWVIANRGKSEQRIVLKKSDTDTVIPLIDAGNVKSSRNSITVDVAPEQAVVLANQFVRKAQE
ncbi:hypothetical protein OE749_16515 [Aestuariibacter sp. AA17]|uniref:Uncharacterized protein n=1 Tax=Fluctibacter corallii TaxID=2984329 RepID=A0ABT3ACE2_9ALTE|nr:hypothetical protein [Aestuariibacter sp. AA17]MCV2886299.1 hypothetical protein [Aestuariibacter sp. AA17]